VNEALTTTCALYHSALEVRIGPKRHVIEMAPVWAGSEDHGAAGLALAERPVGVEASLRRCAS